MRTFLISLFAVVFLCMLGISVAATMQSGIVESSRALWPNFWFRATLLDAYFGFLTFFVWVAYKERSNLVRAVWFMLIMSLGNFAMSSYVLIQLFRTKPFSWEALLLRQTDSNTA